MAALHAAQKPNIVLILADDIGYADIGINSPLQAVEKYQARVPSITVSKRQTSAALLSAMDDAIGRVLAALDQTGQTDRTLIFFTNDNGGPTTRNAVNGSVNATLRGSNPESTPCFPQSTSGFAPPANQPKSR